MSAVLRVRQSGARAAGLRATVGCHRPAFTLLELMIVLVILTVVLAVAWPSLRRPFNRAGTLEAARQLAADVARARHTAIQRGETIALRFELDGSHYRIEPAEPRCGPADSDFEDDLLGDLAAADQLMDSASDESAGKDGAADSAADSSTGSADALQEPPADQPLPPMEPIEQQLPNGVVFVDPATPIEPDPLAAGAGGDLESAPDQDQNTQGDETQGDDLTTLEKLAAGDQQADEQDWSTAVLFYPTGRAESIQWRLKGPDDYWVTITLRGMTGTVEIGRLEHPLRAGTSQEPGAGDGGSEPVKWTDKPLNAAPVDSSGTMP